MAAKIIIFKNFEKQHLPDDGCVERSVCVSSGLNGVEFLNFWGNVCLGCLENIHIRVLLSDAQWWSLATRLESRTGLRCGMKASHEDTHSNHTHKHTPRKMSVSHLCQVRLRPFFSFWMLSFMTFKPQSRVFKPGRIYSVCQPCPKPLRPFYRDENAFVASFTELSSEDRLEPGFSGNDCNFGVHTLRVNKFFFPSTNNINNNSV